jgi:cell division protease FtsH
VVASALPDGDPVRKVTIIPRGIAGGLTWYLTEDEDQRLATKAWLKAKLASAMAGRAAEELVLEQDNITTGASNDLEHVTHIARQMVTRWGMSEKLGPMAYGRKEELVFLGKEIGEQRDFSEAVAEEIDREVHKLVNDAHKIASSLLKKHRKKLEEVAQYLLEYETIEMDQFEALWKGQPIPPPAKPPEPPPMEPKPTVDSKEDGPAPTGPEPVTIPSSA